MHHLALVLVTTAMVLAGSVWHVPAAQTLRAGQDRPCSARPAAAACLVGWGSGLVLAVVLLLAPGFRSAVVVFAVGAAFSIALRVRAVLVRRRERRAEDLVWAELGSSPTGREVGRLRRSVLGWTLGAAAAGSLTVTALLAAGGTGFAALLATGLASAGVAALGALSVQHRISGGGGPAACVEAIDRSGRATP